MVLKKIGERLTKLRKHHNITRDTLSKIMNCTLGTIVNWESGKSSIKIGDLFILRDYYRSIGTNVSISYLLAEEEKSIDIKTILRFLRNSNQYIFYIDRDWNIQHINPTYYSDIVIKKPIKTIIDNTNMLMTNQIQTFYKDFNVDVNTVSSININNHLVEVKLVPYFEDAIHIVGYFVFSVSTNFSYITTLSN